MQTPPDDLWTAAVHVGFENFAPIGAAVVVGERHVLTCAHIAVRDGLTRDGMWLAFPKAVNWRQRRRVSLVVAGEPARVADVALLVLDEPIPAGVAPAPLRFPLPKDLVGRRWWAFGFPGRDPLGSAAEGTVGAQLGYGWVRLDTGSRYLIEPGFSGGGLWSPDYGAIVALVGQANVEGTNCGDGRALTLYQGDLCLPEQRLRAFGGWSAQAAGDTALAAWGWTLGTDPEAGRHWQPRARGVSVDSERGFRFRGRTAALRAIAAWLDRSRSDRRILVVTGSPGVGKSAVLGRIVTTADASVCRELPVDDQAVRASMGSVACAVHAKGKTALDVAAEICRAASAALPTDIEDFAPAMRRALSDGAGRFNVIVDALDEATSPVEVRSIVASVVLPLVQTCADLGAQVLVGTRRRDNGGDVLALFDGVATVIDLDHKSFFAPDDLAAYAQAILQLLGDERPGNPYADDAVAGPVAHRIATLSERNFLVAGLVARTHGLHDEHPVVAAELAFTASVDAALQAYVQRLASVGEVSAADVLAALSFAEAPGWSIRLWHKVVEALTGPVNERLLLRFARSSAANFLVETGDVGTFRLFHQALNDALRRARAGFVDPIRDECAIARTLISDGRIMGWAMADAYLLRSLPLHAARAGMIDELLTDDAYLLNADLRRLATVADEVTTPEGAHRARVLRLTPMAVDEPPISRAALFSVTAATEGLGVDFAVGEPALYRPR